MQFKLQFLQNKPFLFNTQNHRFQTHTLCPGIPLKPAEVSEHGQRKVQKQNSC